MTVGDILDALAKYPRNTTLSAIAYDVLTQKVGIQEAWDASETPPKLLEVTFCVWPASTEGPVVGEVTKTGKEQRWIQ